MNIERLLTQLKDKNVATVSEERTFPEDHKKVIILEGELHYFPHGSRKTWYALVLEDGETEVPEEEFEAILRHFWHGDELLAP